MELLSGRYQRIDKPVILEEAECFTLKVLNKESSVDITGLVPSSTVSDLKEVVQKEHRVDAHLQRLIFNGKPLAPDEKTLIYFGIKDQSVIHLFPRNPPPSAEGSTAITLNPLLNISNNEMEHFNIAAHRPIHFDFLVSQSIREVRLWSYILLIISSMTLFTNLSVFASTGQLGKGSMDSFVTMFETLCAVAGLYVSQLGIRATVLVDIASVAKYSRSICVLTAVMCALRVLWIVDMYYLAKREIREAKAEQLENTDNAGEDNENHDDDKFYPHDDFDDENEAAEEVLAPHFLVYFTIQACLIGAVISGMWISCAARSVRFRHEVEEFERVNNNNNTPVVRRDMPSNNHNSDAPDTISNNIDTNNNNSNPPPLRDNSLVV